MDAGAKLRVRGLVQGVGFRPAVWRLAREHNLAGDVRNDGEGVLIRLWGPSAQLADFPRRLRECSPPLARIDSVELSPLDLPPPYAEFRILASGEGAVHTGVVPDAATCHACFEEIFDPRDRRYRYPFTNCTHCGPRFSIVRGVPYDRANTSMAAFAMCAACRSEYDDPADRRFHAQANACPECGPCAWLEDAAGGRIQPVSLGTPDAVAAASVLLARGNIVAIKGVGGFHLACDASDESAVAELRRRKRRIAKPFALMARDVDVVRRYCRVRAEDEALLRSTAAPITLMAEKPFGGLAAGIAPGQYALGFMLPYSPLHHLLLADWERPLVMTSGNVSDEPQCMTNEEARERLAGIADHFLMHDRDIINRVDDSVARVLAGAPRLLRRARGYAPTALPAPEGLHCAPPILALGGDLKNAVCLLDEGMATLSQHLGDLADARTDRVHAGTLELYRGIYRHEPQVIAVDMHPDYRCAAAGRKRATRDGLTLVEVQHHHAHLAACLAENAWPADAGPVLGVALDGVGYGPDRTLWGGEFLAADYHGFRRLGHLDVTPLPGGDQASRQPWRNAYAQLATHLGWERVLADHGDLESVRWLRTRPLDAIAAMVARGINSPPSSSCGRLFDAVAALLGICRERSEYEGQAAVELETAARQTPGAESYPLEWEERGEMSVLTTTALWLALLEDLRAGRAASLCAARFHAGLASALVEGVRRLAPRVPADTVALSGGVFQNLTLFERVHAELRRGGWRVLTHRVLPCNDGCIALGQAAVAAAHQSW